MQSQSQQTQPDHASSPFALFFLRPLLRVSRAHRAPQPQPQPSATASSSQPADLDDDDVEEIESDEEDTRKAAERAGWGSAAAAAAAAEAARQPAPSVHLDPRLCPPDPPPLWHSGLPFASHIDLNDVAHVRMELVTLAQEMHNNLASIEEHLFSGELHCPQFSSGGCSCQLTPPQPPDLLAPPRSQQLAIRCELLAFLVAVYKSVKRNIVSSLRQLESAFYTLLVDCGADIPLPASPLLDSLIARRMAEVKATADAALQQMAIARADLHANAEQLSKLESFTTVSPADSMVYSLVLHPHTQTSNAFVQLQVNQGRPHAVHSSRTVHISCSSAIDADVTLVDAIICTTESNIDIRSLDVHRSISKRGGRSAKWQQSVSIASHSQAGVNVCVRFRTPAVLPSQRGVTAGVAGHPQALAVLPNMQLAPPPAQTTAPASLPAAAAPYPHGPGETAAAPCTITTMTSQTCTWDARLTQPQPLPFPQPMLGQLPQPHQQHQLLAQHQQQSVAQHQQPHQAPLPLHFAMSAQQQQAAPIPMPLHTHPQPQHYPTTAAAHSQPAHGSQVMPPVAQWSAHPAIDLTCGQDGTDHDPNERNVNRRAQQPASIDAQPAPQSHHLQELTAQQVAYYSRYDAVLE